MVGRSHVFFVILGLALVGCSNSDDSSDTSGQAALNATGSENDDAQAPEADGAPKHKPLLVLCRPPQKMGGAMGGPGGPAPFVPDANRLPEGAPQPQEGGPHEGGPRPLPCVAPAKHLPLLCAPAPFWHEVLKLGGPEGSGPEQQGPGAGPEQGPGAKHPPILCIVAPPHHPKPGSPIGKQGGVGFGGPAPDGAGPGPDANEGPGGFGGEMPKLEPGKIGGKPPVIFACRPAHGGPKGGPEMGGPGGGGPGAPQGGPGAHPPALALACVPLMPPPNGGPGAGAPSTTGGNAPPAPN